MRQMPPEKQDETNSPESCLATLEKTFEDSLAHYAKNPKAETFHALREAQTRLMMFRLQMGRPISDLLPRIQAAKAQAQAPVS